MTYQELEIDTSHPVLSWAGHDLAQQETRMAKNVASLPFVFRHVALMPDVHLGKGALVGSVIATKDAIIPAAVGVDIGCFVGATLIPLVDGKSCPIAELAQTDEEFIVYACTATGKIIAAKATARLTKKNAALIKVTLDNHEEIICTPDHQFMLRDGSYQEAQNLQRGESLMSFYSKVDRNGDLLISQPDSGLWQQAHSIVARAGFLSEIPHFAGQKTVIHHRDCKQSARCPAHLEFTGNRDYSPDRCSLVDLDRSVDRSYIGDIYEPELRSLIGRHNQRKQEYKSNHKVASIERLEYVENVYCLTVPGYNNFALSGGVFVHNCGMTAIQTPFVESQLDGKLKKIRLDLEAQIPVGFEENKQIAKDVTNWQGWQDFKELHRGVRGLENKATRQLGSLGGGNHFIEVCIDTEHQVWLMLHSGSRNVGNKLAQCHIDTAKDLAKLAETSLPDRDLAYFVAGTPEFQAYWRDLQWAQDYAKANREVMMSRFMRVMEQHLNGGKKIKPLLTIDCHHNYAEKEVHFGEEVYVTRKGAVRARTEDYGIIPGSMGTKSYIIKGKGNAQSFCSCSHGAGRIMSRSMAKNTYTLDDLISQTAGVECRKDTELIDEIPAAYKPIEEVMTNQSDLVEVVATLKQVVCIKG